MTAIGADKARKWVARDWLGLVAGLMGFALLFWAMGDPPQVFPPTAVALPVLGLLLAGLLVRSIADARARWRKPRGQASPLLAVTDTDAETRIVRPRLDAALDALSTALYGLGPAWVATRAAGRGDWPRVLVLVACVVLVTWAVIKAARPLFRHEPDTL